ncbi:MAG: transpeptidase family protein [Deltaproteobacteria bacterium]|jgi:cell division protein FtsI (penicillin-binding protein 3)|nr:transpeptidase family protein [Deltaproteobacteria bacterium]
MQLQGLQERARNSLYFILGCFVFCFFCVIVQAVRLQIVHVDELARLGSQSTVRRYSLGSIRGDIFDRNGTKLATSVAVDSVFVDRRSLADVGDAFVRLWTALDMDYEDVASWMENLRQSADLKRHLSPAEAEAVRALGIKGVGLRKEYRRDYPNGSLAAHFLGFVAKDGYGLEGLELALNDMLTTAPDSVRVRRDGHGQIIMDRPEQILDQPQGASVVLTLDSRIQNIAEKAISRAVVERGAKSGMAMVVRPRTGEILASAVYPTFDPNRYSESEMADRRNKVLTDPLEPGSTFKVFTVAAALEDRLVTPDSVFFCENGVYQIDASNVIRDTGSYGDLTVSQIVQKSSNIGASKIGERLAAQRLHGYLAKFGFGQKTGLSFPAGESAGRLRPPNKWVVVDAANIAFGQGLSVTALQLIMAVSSLSNDGILMRPHLVSRIVDARGEVIDSRPPQIVRRAVSPLVARQVMAMMRMAVEKGGTGYRAEVPGYPVSGKTGTAQKVSDGDKGYSSGKYVASFVGVAPYDNPELCVLVILDEPWPAYYGGEVAAPVFREIMGQALPLLDVPAHDNDAPPAWPSLDDQDPSIPGLLTAARPYQLRVALPKGDQGDGPIPSYGGPAGGELVFDRPEPLVAQGVAPVDQGDGPGLMPDLAGLSKREVFELLAPYGLQVEYHGSGLAAEQEPLMGSNVARGQTARVRFGTRGR